MINVRAFARRTSLAALGLFAFAGSALAQYKYRAVPRTLYVVGQPSWDKMNENPDGSRSLRVYASQELAAEKAGGAPIYRIRRHQLEDVPDGERFLQETQDRQTDKTKTQLEVFELKISDRASFDKTAGKAKTGSSLGPPNPNWHTTGPYETGLMGGEYLPGARNDDYNRGTWYAPNEGSSVATDFIKNYKVQFQKMPDGSVRLMRPNGEAPGTYRPIHTLDGHDATITVGGRIEKGAGGQSTVTIGGQELQACLWVMDAQGNFYVLASHWLQGIGDLGFSGINHSSLPSGHPVAAAGLMVVDNGRLIAIDNNSGHYKPSNKRLTQAIVQLEAPIEKGGGGMAKGSYKVGFEQASDHPGTFISLDPNGRRKVDLGVIEKPRETPVAEKPAVGEPAKRRVNDNDLVHPEDPAPSVQREVDRRASEGAKELKALEAPKPVPPPDPAVIDAIREKIKGKTVAQMDVPFMIEVYKMDPSAAKIVGQIMADPSLGDKNAKMGQLRKQMDLMVWKKILSARGIKVEITNQGKSNGIRSDLDYTLYYLAEEAGIPIEKLIEEHGKTWESVHQGIKPEHVEIKVMNGDEFYPDWRNENLSEHEYQARVKEMLGRLRGDKEKYSVPGGNKEQVHNRALRDGWTEELAYNPELDKPEIPIEKQVVVREGLTRDIAARYKDVHPQYNHMNAFGNDVQNLGEYLHHSGDGVQDAIRRAKYGNRVVNLGMGNERFYANSYAQIYDSPADKVWARTEDGREIRRDDLLLDYIRKSFGVLMDDNGKPLFNEADLQKVKRVIDISMQIELDKTGDRTGKKADYSKPEVREEYFKEYKAQAEAKFLAENLDRDYKPEEKAALVLAEQEKLFEADHKRVLAEATLAGLRHSVGRDLTPEGVLRNRVRFDPVTNKFVLDGQAGARKVAFERAVEVALFYELVNSIEDPFMRHDMKKRAMSTAPNQELAEFYGALDEVTAVEIDKFIKNEPGNKVQRTIDDLIAKQQERAMELAIERKEKAVAKLRARGVSVDASAIPREFVRDHIVQKRMWTLSPERRAQFQKAFNALGAQFSGQAKEFREAFHQNASALMLGSSAINLIRAYQSGCRTNPNPMTKEGRACGALLAHAAFSEAVWYMPGKIQTPFLVADILIKARKGEYMEAAHTATFWAAMHFVPSLGHAMLAYNIATGLLEIPHTHFVTRIDQDLTEQALKARPRDENGGPIRDGALGPARARANRMPDAKNSVYNGSPPGFPLFYGLYKNNQAIAPATVINGDKYSDGTVPQDNLGDGQLADTAGIEFASQIDSILTAERLEPGSDAYRDRAWELKLKFGFDIPFYRRIAKVYAEKYKYIVWTDYLSECRMDVYDWYNRQPPGYKDELRGEASGLGWLLSFFRDQTDKMQERIAQECARVLTEHHQLIEMIEESDQADRAAFSSMMNKAFDAERSVVAAKQALYNRIKTEEEKAVVQVEKRALELAERHKTSFVMSYPFTYATEEMPPNLDFKMRSIPSKVKGPVSVAIDQEIIGLKEGAPGGWRPGKQYEDKFKPDADGWVALRPITADLRFTGHLLDKDSTEVALAKLELPMVLYEPTVNGSIAVTVYGMGEKGDSFLYNGALVTLEKRTKETGPIYGSTGFERLKPGTYSVQVVPRKGDERHGPGTGSGTIVDELLSNDPKASDYAEIIVKLPYIPEKKPVADSTRTNTNTGGTGSGGTGKDDKPGTGGGTGGKTGKDSTGTGRDSTSTGGKGGKDSTTAGPNVDDIIRGLAPLTSKAEKARDDAKRACQYIQAAAAQQELVTAAKDFVAKSFPKGAPPNIQQMVAEFEAELATLKKTATAQEAANVHLREGLAAVRAKRAEPALDALEKALQTPDIPECLHKQIEATYNEMKADVEKRMKLIDLAVEAANDKCDYAAAQGYGEQVEAIDKTLSWVVQELPRIKQLNQRQKQARTLAQQAEDKAAAADAAAAAGDKAQATTLYDEALQLAQRALAAAPPCEKENLKHLLDLPARKANMNNPKVDQSLVLLLDTSGSMGSDNKMENAKSAATDAVKSLGPTTEVALISYDGGCAGGWRVVQGFTTNHQSLISAIASLRPGGGTPTAPAIGFAHEYLQKNGHGKAGQIMLMTDGQNDCGSMVDAGNGLRRSTMPVRIDAVGFGLPDGSQAQKDLGDLVRASGGGGGSYSANNAKELISAFRRAFITTQVKQRDPVVTGEAGTRLAALFAAAIEALKAGNMRGAIDQFRGAADQFPASPSAAFNASLAYEAGGQPLQAMNYANRYLQLAPNAFDAGQVRARIEMLEKEQAANPRAIYSPTDCGELYRWATRESRTPGMDAARKAKVFEILTTAQRGDCAAAKEAFDKYNAQYGKKP